MYTSMMASRSGVHLYNGLPMTLMVADGVLSEPSPDWLLRSFSVKTRARSAATARLTLL